MPETQDLQENREQKSTNTFPCKNCGGKMDFDPESGLLLCSYCGSKYEIPKEETEIKEYNLSEAKDGDKCDWGTETNVIKCDSCGAETVLEAGNTAQFCAFCGSSHVIRSEEFTGIAPESLIPFSISEKNARQLFTDWVKKKFFAPGALKSNYQMERMKGIYIPYWTYDADTRSNYTAEGGTYYYVKEIEWVEENGQKVEKTKEVRKVRWWPTSGSIEKSFNDILVNASKKVDAKLMKNLENFNKEGLVPFRPEYLSGFLAERYSVSLNEGWKEARQVIHDNLSTTIKSRISADEVRNLNFNTAHSNVKYKHVLFPMWISAFKFKDKTYTYMINGQNGDLSGHFPRSVLKIIATILITFGVIGVITFLTGGMGALLFPFAIVILIVAIKG